MDTDDPHVGLKLQLPHRGTERLTMVSDEPCVGLKPAVSGVPGVEGPGFQTNPLWD